MQSFLDALILLAVLGGGFGLFVLVGWALSRLRGGDGPLTPVDRHTVSDHLRSRWF